MRLSDVLIRLGDVYSLLAEHQDTDRASQLARVTRIRRDIPPLPPGADQILDADQRNRLRIELHDFASALCLRFYDNGVIDYIPHDTPHKYQTIAKYIALLPDGTGFRARQLLERAERLITPTQKINVGQQCFNPNCPGHYEVDAAEHEPPLICNKCRDEIPYSRWESWPKTHAYITPLHAAHLLGISYQAVKQRASRNGWKRQRIGNHVRYLLEDVARDRNLIHA